jgi:hypothetical protein
MIFEPHDSRSGTEIITKRKYKKYTYNDVWSAYLRGMQTNHKLLSRPEWYTILSTLFGEWHKERFNGKHIL